MQLEYILVPTSDDPGPNLDAWSAGLATVAPDEDAPPTLIFNCEEHGDAVVFLKDEALIKQDTDYLAIRSVGAQLRVRSFLCISMAWCSDYETGKREEQGFAVFLDKNGEARCWLTDIERSETCAPEAKGWEERLLDFKGPMLDAMKESLSRSPSTLRTSSKEKVSRNAPCPCGSGSKAKKCCGGAS